MAGSNVIEVTDQTFNEKVLKSDKLVMVDFWATWCGPCLALAPTLESLANEYEGRVSVARLNVDENHKVAARHRITSIPTIVFYKNGRLLGSLVGLRPKAQYKDIIEKLLE